MILRDIQRGEVIVIGLDLVTLIDGESHGTEDIYDLVSYLGIRMELALLMLLLRERDIDGLLLVAGFSLLRLELLVHLVKFTLRPVLDLIDHLTVIGLELLRDLPHLFHERSDLSFLGIHDTLFVLIDTL